MTKELAIIILKSLVEYYNDKNEDSYVGFDAEDNESIDMAIKVLEQQPCENCVSREEVIRIIKDHPRIVGDRSVLVQKVVELPPATSSYNSIKTELTDCISREAVLDIAKSSKSNWIDNSVLFKRVNELPLVTPKTEWIPCSEGLPEREGWYLISLGDKTYGGADVDMYCKGWVKYGTHVLAWMPLPPCYEPQESEDKE